MRLSWKGSLQKLTRTGTSLFHQGCITRTYQNIPNKNISRLISKHIQLPRRTVMDSLCYQAHISPGSEASKKIRTPQAYSSIKHARHLQQTFLSKYTMYIAKTGSGNCSFKQHTHLTASMFAMLYNGTINKIIAAA